MITFLRRGGYGRETCAGIAAKCAPAARVQRVDRPIRTPLVPDCWIRWGSTARIHSNPAPSIVLNTREAIHQVSDKRAFREILALHNLCPRTWLSAAAFHGDDTHTYPVILRPALHHGGQNFYVCNSNIELADALDNITQNAYYITELIEKRAEYRVMVMQGRAVWVAQKTPGHPEDIAWNITQGGHAANERWDDWPLRAIRVAIEAFNLTLLDFGAVDVIVGQDDQCYVLEINTAPLVSSEYRQQCMAKVFDYMATVNSERLPLVTKRGGYTKFIHPAICDKAILV